MKAYIMTCGTVLGHNKIFAYGEIATADKFPVQNIDPLCKQGFMRPLTEEEQADFEKKEADKALENNLDKEIVQEAVIKEEQADFEKKEVVETIESLRKKLQSKGVRYGKDESKESLLEKLKAISE
jgi:hypothetical protein